MEDPRITLYLGVHASDAHLGWSSHHSVLYSLSVSWPSVPSVGSSVAVCDKQGEHDFSVPIKGIEWYTTGAVEIELVGFQTDPVPSMLPLLTPDYRMPWNTEDSGDLHACLLDAGWIRV